MEAAAPQAVTTAAPNAWAVALDRLEAEMAAENEQVALKVGSFRYQRDPHAWSREVLAAHLWSKQVEIMESVRDNRRTAVPSAHGVGKSFLAARIVAWWLSVHPPGEAFVVTTAPTGDQVTAILWREIRVAHASGRLPGRVGVKQWHIGEHLVAIGRKPADTNPAAFQGLHARYILVVIDEADGVASLIWGAVKTLATNIHARILAIGNPDSGSGAFFDACQPDSGWNVIRISAFDSPNFTGEAIPDDLGELLVDAIWVDELRDECHGDESDPRYRSKVLALPPSDDPLGVVPHSAVMDAIRRADPLPLDDEDRVRWDDVVGEVVVGVDVGAGGDVTVAWERRGQVLARNFRIRTNDPVEAANGIAAFLRDVGAQRVQVDEVGIGWGLAGLLEQSRLDGGHSARVVRVNVGEAPSDPVRFVRRRSELWWFARESLIAGAWDLRTLAGRDGESVVAQLIAPRWAQDNRGRIAVEEKRETIKRLRRSPDDADAILLAYWSPTVATPLVEGAWRRHDVLPPPDAVLATVASWWFRFDDGPRPLCVGQVWLATDARAVLVEQVREPLDLPGLVEAMAAQRARWPDLSFRLVPTDGNGPGTLAALAAAGPVLRRDVVDDADGVGAIAPDVLAGKVSLPRHDWWAADLIAEAARFPSSVEGSMVRAMVQALTWLRSGRRVSTYRDDRLAGRR